MDVTAVLHICKQIKENGKTPSMALIKARSTQAIPIPLIISALKRFKEMSEQEINSLSHSSNKQQREQTDQAKLSNTQRIEKLEAELATIKQQLKAMKSLLSASNLE